MNNIKEGAILFQIQVHFLGGGRVNVMKYKFIHAVDLTGSSSFGLNTTVLLIFLVRGVRFNSQQVETLSIWHWHTAMMFTNQSVTKFGSNSRPWGFLMPRQTSHQVWLRTV